MKKKWNSEVLHNMRSMMAASRGQGISMRTRLILYWLSMAFAILGILMVILSMTGMFSLSAKRLKESLLMLNQNTTSALSSQINVLTGQSLTLSKQATSGMADVLMDCGKSFEEINDDPAVIQTLEEMFYPMQN